LILIARRHDRTNLAIFPASQLMIPTSTSKLVQHDFFHIFQMPAQGRLGRFGVVTLDSRQDTPVS
jgi:hypothetical protein